jgi:hypothetical protein
MRTYIYMYIHMYAFMMTSITNIHKYAEVNKIFKLQTKVHQKHVYFESLIMVNE